MVIILMGVSGSGKTTIGKQLSIQLSIPFFDADDFHPTSNIEKMKNNIPLADEDREPWLNILSKKVIELNSLGGGVLACSALKECYRKILSPKKDDVFWIYLYGSHQLIEERMKNRDNHYMKPKLLQSQFDIIEVPDYALHIDIREPIENIIIYIKSNLK